MVKGRTITFKSFDEFKMAKSTINFPEQLDKIYISIAEETPKQSAKRVKVEFFRNQEWFKYLKQKAKDFNRDDIANYLEQANYLPKGVVNTNFTAYPSDGPDEDSVVKGRYGTFIKALSEVFIKAKFSVMKALKEFRPEYDFSPLMCAKPLRAGPPDIPSTSTKKAREELNLSNETKDEEINQFDLFFWSIFGDFSYSYKLGDWIKKEGSPGPTTFIEVGGKLFYHKDYTNEEDEFGIYKIKLIERLLDNYDEIMALIHKLDFDSLLKKFNIVLISRAVHRLQEDSVDKKRKVTTIDSIQMGEPVLAELDYLSQVKIFLKNILINLDQTIRKFVRGARERFAYASEASLAVLSNALLKDWRYHMKIKYPFVFKFASDMVLEYRINKKYKEVQKNNGRFFIVAGDVAKFDHTLKPAWLYNFHKLIGTIDLDLGLILAVSAICPILIGNAGRSIKNHMKKMQDIILGNPLDINTWFFGVGKSGDADVADRCKLACSFLVTRIILKVLGLEFNEDNIKRCLNGELAVAFINLGDNNLLFGDSKYLQMLDKAFKEDEFLRFEFIDKPIFGGKLVKYNKMNDRYYLVKSPTSLVLKMLVPEYSMDSEDHKGWTQGFKQRIQDAKDEFLRTGDNQSGKILEIVFKTMAKELKSSSIYELISRYEKIFLEEQANREQLLYAIAKNYKNDKTISEIALDNKKILWKFELEELPNEVQKVLREQLFNCLKTEYKNKLYKEIA